MKTLLIASAIVASATFFSLFGHAATIPLSEVASVNLDEKQWEWFHTTKFYPDGGVWMARNKANHDISMILRTDRGYIYPPEKIDLSKKFLSYCTSLAKVHGKIAEASNQSLCKVEAKNANNGRHKIFLGYFKPASSKPDERSVRYHSVQIYYPENKKKQAERFLAEVANGFSKPVDSVPAKNGSKQ